MRRIAIAGALVALAAVFLAGDGAEATPAECRVYSTAPGFVAGTLQTIPCNTDGEIIVSGGGGGGGTSSAYGDPFPADGTAAGFQDANGDMAPVVLEADGSLPVTVVGGGGGGGDVNITEVGGNAVTTTVPISGSVGVTGTVAATQSGTWTLGANSGVDIGDVTVNNAAGGAAVNIQDGGNTITVDGAVTVSGTATVSGTVAATQSGSWNIGTVTAVTGITNALPAGTNNIGDVDIASGTVAATQSGTWTVQPGNTANTTPWLVSLVSPTAGGCTPAKTLSAASTNATSIKASAGTLCSLTVINTNAAVYYLKLYNVSSAPTCNSSTVVQTIPVPASTTGAGVSVDVGPYGWAFSTGIGLCLTGGLADNDNTNAATGVAISYSYK